MTRRSFLTLGCLCALVASGCADSVGGSTLAGNPVDINGMLSHYVSANEDLKAGNLESAKAVYQAILRGDANNQPDTALSATPKDLSNGNLSIALSTYQQTVVGTPQDPVANFGIGLITLAQLGESEIGTAILAKFGQPPLATSLVLGPTGYLAQLDALHQACSPGAPSAAALPFGTLPHVKRLWWRRLLTQADPTLTSDDVFFFSQALLPIVQEVVAEWEIAALDANFSFTLPKELFYANSDIVVTHADLTLGIAALKAVVAGINLANAWTAEIALGTLVDASGELLISPQALALTANQFFALTPNATEYLAAAKTALRDALLDADDALAEYLTGDGSAALIVNESNAVGVQELVAVVQDVIASFEAITPIATTNPVLHLDLGNFFAHPPDAATIDIDPFVVEFTGNAFQINPVESFFQEFFNQAGTADLQLKEHFSIFTSAVKGKTFRQVTFGRFTELFKDPNVPGCKP